MNLGPQGAIPDVQKKRLEQIGRWLGTYGEAICGTRICAPFAAPDVDYTQTKDGATRYAIVKRPSGEVTLACPVPAGSKIVEIASGRELAFARAAGGVRMTLPADLAAREIPFAVRIGR